MPQVPFKVYIVTRKEVTREHVTIAYKPRGRLWPFFCLEHVLLRAPPRPVSWLTL